MGIGTSDGQYHDDEMEYQLARAKSTPKQVADATEIGFNETSGDFQSRFGASTDSTMPPGASTELRGALESKAGILPTVGEPPIRNGGTFSEGTDLGNQLADYHANKLYGMGQGIVNAMALPGDVLSGKVQPGSIQEIERAADLAGLMVGGPAPVAKSMADGTLGSFAGVGSKTLNKAKLYEATEMHLNGAHPDDIWTQTGFAQGADGKWRYEIPDTSAKLKTENFNTNDPRYNVPDPKSPSGWSIAEGDGSGPTISPKNPLRDADMKKMSTFQQIEHLATADTHQPLSALYDHPELYEAYPFLKNVKVEEFPHQWNVPDTTWGMAIGKDSIMVKPLAPDVMKSVLAHEVQHMIQKHEGFARGGSPQEYLPPELPKAQKDFESMRATEEPKIAEELGTDSKGIAQTKRIVDTWLKGNLDKPVLDVIARLRKASPENFEKLKNIVKSEQLLTKAEEEARSKYTNLMGEVEARNVQTRLNFDKWDSKSNSPLRTEDTPRFNQVFKDQGGVAHSESTEIPGKFTPYSKRWANNDNSKPLSQPEQFIKDYDELHALGNTLGKEGKWGGRSWSEIDTQKYNKAGRAFAKKHDLPWDDVPYMPLGR